jgi:two-component system cell cycle response regulator DivK
VLNIAQYCAHGLVTSILSPIPIGQSTKKVLVADDQAAGRELIRTILEHSGHAVWEACDGTEAVRFASEILPDLILLDLHMPMLDGFEVIKELRSRRKLARTPIVALTASAMRGDRERALSAGFTSYISKPISLRALRTELERWLG